MDQRAVDDRRLELLGQDFHAGRRRDRGRPRVRNVRRVPRAGESATIGAATSWSSSGSSAPHRRVTRRSSAGAVGVMGTHTVLLSSASSRWRCSPGGMAMRSVSRTPAAPLGGQQLRGPRRMPRASAAPHHRRGSTVALVLVLSGSFLAAGYARQPCAWPHTRGYAAAMIVVNQLFPRAIARRFAPAVASLPRRCSKRRR